MKQNFPNIYHFKLTYDLKDIDHDVMGSFMELVNDLELKLFELRFGMDLRSSKQAYEINKRFNKKLVDKKELRTLKYNHQFIDGFADTVEESRKLINKVMNM